MVELKIFVPKKLAKQMSLEYYWFKIQSSIFNHFFSVGHSLGGAMASIAASYLVQVGLFQGSDIKLVRFNNR